jgi:hypothetical protein
MKTNRKKMLLSSIAMLLVALVALGSATYAWFTMNKTVSADGMTVTAATSAGLQITGSNGVDPGNGKKGWVRDWHFAAINDALTPTSIGFTANSLETDSFLPGEVEREGAYVAAAAGQTASATKWAQGDSLPTATLAGVSNGSDASAVTSNKQIIGYRVGVRSSRADTPISGVTMNLTYNPDNNETNNAGQFIRIVVADSTGAPVAYYAGGGALAVTSVANKLPDGTADQPTTNSLSYSLASSVTNAAPQYFNIYVWFEGQDQQCVDANQAASGSLKVTFSYT